MAEPKVPSSEQCRLIGHLEIVPRKGRKHPRSPGAPRARRTSDVFVNFCVFRKINGGFGGGWVLEEVLGFVGP